MAKKVKKLLGDNAVALSDFRRALRPSEKGTTRLMQLGLTNGTAQRVLEEGDGDVYLATLDTIATGLKVEPWQLLVPNFHPDRLPQLAAETTMSPQAHQAAKWLDEMPAAQRDQVYSLWDSVRGLVAHGMTVQIISALPAAPSPAEDAPLPSATRRRSP